MVRKWFKWPLKWILIIFGLVMTVKFDLLTSKSTQLICVPKCTKVVNMPKQFIKYCVYKFIG